jgi:hypothetical protein
MCLEKGVWMNSDKAIELLEYITKKYDVVLSEHSMTTILYPKATTIHVKDRTFDRIIERFCRELVKYTCEQFKKGIEDIINEEIHN